MKRLIMLGLVLMAGLSEAASVQWNSGAINAPNGDGTFGALIGASSAYSSIVYFYTDAGITSVAGVTGNTDGVASIGSAFNNTTSDSFSGDTTYYAKLVVTANSGLWIMTSTVTSFTMPGTGNAGITFLSGAGFDSVANKMPGQWTAVPEPTSMALFGLGAAALGLRRRFQKKS